MGFPQHSGAGNPVFRRFRGSETGPGGEIRQTALSFPPGFPKTCGKLSFRTFQNHEVFHSLWKELLINVKGENSENLVEIPVKSSGKDYRCVCFQLTCNDSDKVGLLYWCVKVPAVLH